MALKNGTNNYFPYHSWHGPKRQQLTINTMRFFAAVKIPFRIFGVTAVAGAHSATYSTGPGNFFRVVKWSKREAEYLTQCSAEDNNVCSNGFTAT